MQTEAACWQLRTVKLMFYATESRNFVVYKKGRQKISRISRTAACSHEVPQQPAVGDRHCSTTAIPTPRQGPAASRKSSQHLRELTTSKQSKQQKNPALTSRLRELLLNSISTGRSAVPVSGHWCQLLRLCSNQLGKEVITRQQHWPRWVH